jgi:D-alanine-D-alanine ligase
MPNGVTPIVTAKYIEEELRSRGYDISVFDFNNIEQSFYELGTVDVNLVFNVTEGINNNEQLKSQAAAMIESLQIPCIGSNSYTIAFCQDKIRMKKLFTYHDVPTPAWDYAYSVNDVVNKDLKYPLVVKPSNTDDSYGITNSSVVTNKRELTRQLKKIIEVMGRPALIEEYIDGDEYEVSIIGNSQEDLRVLPLTRSVFKKMPKGYWHMYTREAKRQENPAYKKIVLERASKAVNPKLEALITEIAIDAYKIMQCRDYGRVGIRVDKEGNPYVLEVDTNPPLNPETEMVRAAKLTGMDFGDVLEEIINVAVKRYKKENPTLP